MYTNFQNTGLITTVFDEI